MPGPAFPESGRGQQLVHDPRLGGVGRIRQEREGRFWRGWEAGEGEVDPSEPGLGRCGTGGAEVGSLESGEDEPVDGIRGPGGVPDLRDRGRLHGLEAPAPGSGPEDRLPITRVTHGCLFLFPAGIRSPVLDPADQIRDHRVGEPRSVPGHRPILEGVADGLDQGAAVRITRPDRRARFAAPQEGLPGIDAKASLRGAIGAMAFKAVPDEDGSDPALEEFQSSRLDLVSRGCRNEGCRCDHP